MILLSDLKLPSPPKAALRLVELCADPNAELREIVEVIAVDAALAGRLLKVANSAYYGQQREVATLNRAVVVLGAEHVKVVALAFHLVELTKDWCDLPIDLARVWQGNVLRACLARRLTMFCDRTMRGCQAEAFLVGLLQDFGVPVLAREVGASYAEWLGAGGLFTPAEIIAREEESVGESHAALAGRICEQWSFPVRIAVAIKEHHHKPPLVRSTDLAGALAQVSYFVGAVPFNSDQCTAKVSARLRHLALAAFDLDTPKLGQAFYGAVEDYETLRSVFDGALPDDLDVAAVMRSAKDLLQSAEQTDTPGLSD